MNQDKDLVRLVNRHVNFELWTEINVS